MQHMFSWIVRERKSSQWSWELFAIKVIWLKEGEGRGWVCGDSRVFIPVSGGCYKLHLKWCSYTLSSQIHACLAHHLANTGSVSATLWLGPKMHPIPYVVHNYWPGTHRALAKRSALYRVPFGRQNTFHFFNQSELANNKQAAVLWFAPINIMLVHRQSDVQINISCWFYLVVVSPGLRRKNILWLDWKSWWDSLACGCGCSAFQFDQSKMY